MKYIDRIMEDTSKFLEDAKTLSVDELDQRKINSLYSTLGTHIEILLKEVFLSENAKNNSLSNNIQELKNLFESNRLIDNLERIRELYNSAKHNPNTVNSISEFKTLVSQWRELVSICSQITNFSKLNDEEISNYRRIFWGFAWDHYIGGDTEISIFLPSYDNEVAMLNSIDLFYIKMEKWTDLQHNLAKIGHFKKGRDCFPSKIYEFYSNESDFLAGFEFEGHYSDLVKTISMFKMENDLLPGLNRSDQNDSMIQSYLLATIEAAKSFKIKPPQDIIIKRIHGMAKNMFGVSEIAKNKEIFISNTIPILDIDFSLWKYLKEPRLVSEKYLGDLNLSTDRVLFKNQYFTLTSDLYIFIKLKKTYYHLK